MDRSLQLTVVIPTLVAGEPLRACLTGLARECGPAVTVVVVDNSGEGKAVEVCRDFPQVQVLENEQNQGFGAAINRGWRESSTPLVASLNDDATVAPGWAAALLSAAETSAADVGSWACCVLLDNNRMDSAGMLLARDGSSRQRGHNEAPARYHDRADILCPSGSAAMFRRTMLEQIGFFEEDFFLYCEDTDLGLRAQWAGWRSEYVPEAQVLHRYSQTAGRASPRKAYYVERNRLRLVFRNFPFWWLATAPFYSIARYIWHVLDWLGGQGKAAEYRASGGAGWRLPLYVVQAHWDALLHLPILVRQRQRIRRTRKIKAREFAQRAGEHDISVRQVATV